MITLLQFMINIQQCMVISREILAHDKKYIPAVYGEHTTTYGYQQEIISIR